MFRARTAGSASTVDSDGRSYRRGGADGQSRGFGAVLGTLARVVNLIVAIVVLIIVAGIVLVLLKANPTNAIVADVHDAARWLAGPFDGIFSLHSARVAVAVNWGLAAVVYAVVGGLIVRLLGSRRY
jgi:hypothetical protein